MLCNENNKRPTAQSYKCENKSVVSLKTIIKIPSAKRIICHPAKNSAP